MCMRKCLYKHHIGERAIMTLSLRIHKIKQQMVSSNHFTSYINIMINLHQSVLHNYAANGSSITAFNKFIMYYETSVCKRVTSFFSFLFCESREREKRNLFSLWVHQMKQFQHLLQWHQLQQVFWRARREDLTFQHFLWTLEPRGNLEQ